MLLLFRLCSLLAAYAPQSSFTQLYLTQRSVQMTTLTIPVRMYAIHAIATPQVKAKAMNLKSAYQNMLWDYLPRVDPALRHIPQNLHVHENGSWGESDGISLECGGCNGRIGRFVIGRTIATGWSTKTFFRTRHAFGRARGHQDDSETWRTSARVTKARRYGDSHSFVAFHALRHRA